MNRVLPPLAETADIRPQPQPRALHRVVLHSVALLLAAIAFVAYQHFRLSGQSTQVLVSLVTAGVLAIAPVCALLGAVFAIEGKALHALHGIGSLAFVGLAAGGVISGQPLLNHAAMAPFALMGAAQAIMHQDHPRNAKQAAALQQFARSLPEVGAFAGGDLTSPANAARAIRVLNDLISKAQVLGETELEADPQFQSAWRRASMHTGLALGLDSIDQMIDRLAASPAAAAAVPDLRHRVATVRKLAAEASQR